MKQMNVKVVMDLTHVANSDISTSLKMVLSESFADIRNNIIGTYSSIRNSMDNLGLDFESCLSQWKEAQSESDIISDKFTKEERSIHDRLVDLLVVELKNLHDHNTFTVGTKDQFDLLIELCDVTLKQNLTKIPEHAQN